jgi:hypothetical protein
MLVIFLDLRFLGVRMMDATMITSDPLVSRFYEADEHGICPECGAVMNENERLTEGPYTYIWLACSKSDCDGQWMQKRRSSSFNGV